MSSAPVAPAYYAEFSGMEALKKGAQQNQPTAVREAARQFESLFTNMLLKSMREASMGESLGDSEQTQFYQDMFDQQLALQMSRGKGLGLAEHLVGQLQRAGAAPATTGAPAAGAIAAPASRPVTATDASAGPVASGAAATGASLARRTHFISSMQPYAAEAGRRLGVAPETIIAHAALETGWGQHLPVGNTGGSHNLFGIKAGRGWTGAAADAITTEYQGSAATSQHAPFRAYDSIGAGMQDYVGLLSSNPRYAGALNCGNDVVAYANGLQRGGFATDPAYVQKLLATCAAVREAAAHTGLKATPSAPITSRGGTI